jgi:superfamily II DNA/RNA helicase
VALRDLGCWLLDLPAFRKRADTVLVDAACRELEVGTRFTRLDAHQSLEHDWSYLLLCASTLSHAGDSRCQAVALRIAQTCFCDESATDVQRDSAALVLDSLANHPAIDLAVRRELLRPSFEERLPGAARFDFDRRSIEQSILSHDFTSLRVNRFQKQLWNVIRNPGWMSVSAPTSAGKSFIMARCICELMRQSETANIVYLVPTRALISQVERDLRDLFREEGLEDVSVSALPILRVDESMPYVRRRVLVFTQERLHILLSSHSYLDVLALIVDEAHKVGDRQRGVLLQDVIERLGEMNKELRVLFASPMTSNPEVLLADVRDTCPTHAFANDDVTVTQNLFWVVQRPRKPRIWDISLCVRDTSISLGSIELEASPSPESKRLSFIAHAIAGSSHGNIVYVNGAAEAEKIANQLYDLIGVDVADSSKDLQKLVELVQHIVHEKFLLATYLQRGIAFHYGNMPLLIREEIERLFTAGTIRYLVCTATLIEGVNMSCRNIFMRGPTKGRGSPLSAEDFWNLAGRAGRWGKEFQGNIFCIDPDRKDLWGPDGPPRERSRQPIRRTTDDVLREPAELVEFIRKRAPLDFAKKRPAFEYVFSYLAGIHVRFGGLIYAPWARRYEAGSLDGLADAVKEAVEALEIEPDIIARNPGISPFALHDLLEYFRGHDGDVEELLPADPASNDAAEVYAGIFGRLCRRACPNLGPEDRRSFMLALLVTRWMRGFPLTRLIQDRIDYFKKKSRPADVAVMIRTVMNEVERIARFEAPRGLSCYCDVLRQHLREIEREDLLHQLPLFNVFLELGVNQQTQIALIGIGLSRTSTIAVSELITADSLTESQVLLWLEANFKLWSHASLPALVKREIERVLAQHKARKSLR